MQCRCIKATISCLSASKNWNELCKVLALLTYCDCTVYDMINSCLTTQNSEVRISKEVKRWLCHSPDAIIQTTECTLFKLGQ